MGETGFGSDDGNVRFLKQLANEDVIGILYRLSGRPQSAKELEAQVGTSLKTIYRHLNLLERHGLIGKRTTVDRDGNHYATYETTVEEIDVSIEPLEGEIEITCQRPDRVDDFVSVWSGLREQAETN